MAKPRVSMKGRGAALFYGDDAPALEVPTQEVPAAEVLTPETAPDVPEHAEATPVPALLVASPRSEVLTERTVERTNGRTIIRHSFDIRRDQLQALAEIQAQVFATTGRKPKMGELAQDALDLYIAAARERNLRRSNE